MTRLLWLLSVMILTSRLFGQVGSKPVEGLRENTPRVHALKGATVIPAPGKRIEQGTIVLRDGLIEAVGGPGLQVPADARSWDLSGKTIYPGFIDPWVEIKPPKTAAKKPAKGDAKDSATLTPTARHWNHKIHPEKRADQALNAISTDTAGKLRGIGFTCAQLVPGEGIFRGISCLISLGDGASGERILSKRLAQCAAFEHGGGGYPSSLMGSISLMRQTLYDAQWRRDAQARYAENPKGSERPEANESLDVLRPVVDGRQRVLFHARDELSYARFRKVAGEFGLKTAFLGNGFEYRVAGEVKRAAKPLVVPINFPPPPPIEDPDAALEISLAELEHWEFAPSNPAFLEASGIPFSLSTARLPDAGESFWKNLRACMERGLSRDTALAALTTEPAKLLGAGRKIGTIAKGKIANLVVADRDLFGDDEARILSVWVDGKRFEQKAAKKVDLAGRWKIGIEDFVGDQEWEISGDAPSLKVKFGDESWPAKIANGRLLAFPAAKAIGLDTEGVARLSAPVSDPRKLSGTGIFPGGERFTWNGVWQGKIEPDKDKEDDQAPEAPELVFDRYPAGAFGVSEPPVQPAALLVRGATVWTSGKPGTLDNADLLIERGKIIKVGKGLRAPEGAQVIDAAGRHVTPGLIDCHAHSAISRGVNEGTHAVTVEVRIGDVVDPTDIALYRQLAGGLTAANLLHGSANPMGGQNQVIKLRWGNGAEGLKFAGAKPGVKFALGENVKQSNWGDNNTTRYPQTRMGVEQIMKDTFLAARDYDRARASAAAGKRPARRDLRMDAALEILKGERIVHIHSYRQDEILMFIRLAEELGFTVGTFQHILEGYKVADAIAKLGAGGSSFSDWWAYKIEVYDAIPYNGALMHDVGVVTSFNSDNAELATRMNLEAAKAVKYGGLPEDEALKFVTLNPARQLRIDDRVGSLEPGKDADFVIWSAHPMTSLAVAQETWIDGRRYYSLEQDAMENDRIQRQRERLIAKALPERVKALAKTGKQDEEGDGKEGEETKPGFWFQFPNRAARCRSIDQGLYHNGNSLHTCSRTNCCGER